MIQCHPYDKLMAVLSLPFAGVVVGGGDVCRWACGECKLAKYIA